MPAGERAVFFNNKELAKRSAKVPHPPLLFAVVKGNWYIFALLENARPQAVTALQLAPYFNVFESNAICIGSTRVPRVSLPRQLLSGKTPFADSEFTHINGATKATHPKGEYALREGASRWPVCHFSNGIPASSGQTLSTLMTAIRKALGAVN